MTLRVKTHAIAILLALLVGVVYAAPDVYHASTQGYQAIIMADAQSSDFYLSAINKSYASPTPIGDPFQYEYQNAHNPFQFFLIEFASGKIGAALHLPLDVLRQIMDFIFPALLLLLLYALAYYMSGSRLTGCVVSVAMLLGNELVQPTSIHNLLHTFLLNGNYTQFLTYSRPINPQISGIFFFVVLFGLAYLLRNPCSKWAMVLSGAALGLLVYIYPYFWAFAFVLLGVMFLYALVVRHWRLLFATFIVGLINLLCMLPFLLLNLSIFLHGGGSDLTQAIPTHRVIIEKFTLVPLFLYILIFLFAWWNRGTGTFGTWASVFRNKYIFVPLLLITGVIVSNQQVITGKLVFQEHFHFFTNIPVFIFAMSLLGMELLLFIPRIWRILIAGLIMLVLAWFAVGIQVSSYKSYVGESLRYQELAPIFFYLRDSAPPQSVVLTDWYLSTQITMYTQDFAYATGNDATFVVPQVRLINDYFTMLDLRGVTAQSVRSYIYQPVNRDEIGQKLYIGTFWRDSCGSDGCFPNSILESLIPQYQAFVSTPLLTDVEGYKINFVLVDSVEDADWKNVYQILGTPVYRSGDFTLYAIKQ